MSLKVRTRFAPSPTGMLHIGGARTALFNYLYAKHMGGDYVLRIEDTDLERSTPEAIDAILEGLKWLDIPHEGAPVYQTKQQPAHIAAAHKMLENGNAYKCYCTHDELEKVREQQTAAGEKTMYNQKCRTRTDAPATPFTVRLKTPHEGMTTWVDAIQGEINYPNKELDDLVLLRSDGTPTYNLAVVVDDANMGITHVIRGDDHINNTPKQILIYQALGLTPPIFAHVPLIHGDDGKKLSKRHGAVSVTSFRDEGFLPEALSNYLLQLGWSYEEDIINRETAIEHFDITDINKGAANFNTQKLEWLNSQYLMKMDGQALFKACRPFLPADLTPTQEGRLLKGLPGLAKRAKRLTTLAESAAVYLAEQPIQLGNDALAALTPPDRGRLQALKEKLSTQNDWSIDGLDGIIQTFIAENSCKMPEVGKPLRAALLGTTQAPALGEVLWVLGKDETLARLSAFA